MKESIILLHGAIGAAQQLEPLETELKKHFNVYRFNFEGHGGSNLPSSFSIDLFSQNLTDFIREKKLHAPTLFGYSMGGYVALHAISKGEKVARLITLGTKFSWTPQGAAKEVLMLNPEIIETKVPKFAEYQTQLHAPNDWKTVITMTADMMTQLGDAPSLNDNHYTRISTPTLCLLGDKDSMVTREETTQVVETLIDGSFQLIDNCPHPIEKIPVEKIAQIILAFCTN